MREVRRMMPEKALVRLVEKSVLESRSFELARIQYDRTDDWEVGVVEQVGSSPEWDGLEVEDHVIVRSGGVHRDAGGAAGADVSRVLGESRGSLIVISPTDVVTKVVPDGE